MKINLELYDATEISFSGATVLTAGNYLIYQTFQEKDLTRILTNLERFKTTYNATAIGSVAQIQDLDVFTLSNGQKVIRIIISLRQNKRVRDLKLTNHWSSIANLEKIYYSQIFILTRKATGSAPELPDYTPTTPTTPANTPTTPTTPANTPTTPTTPANTLAQILPYALIAAGAILLLVFRK